MRDSVEFYCGTFHGMSKPLLIESDSWIDEPHHVDEAPYRFVERLKRLDAEENRLFQFDHVLVDEFQDVNAIQHELILLLTRKAQTVMIVGDPDQNIYEFRCSSVEFLYDHARDIKQSETLFLRIQVPGPSLPS